MTAEERANQIFDGYVGGTKQGLIELVVYHIKEALAEEREACAGIAENVVFIPASSDSVSDESKIAFAKRSCESIAQAIRARREKK